MEYFFTPSNCRVTLEKMVGHQNEKSHVKTFTIRIHYNHLAWKPGYVGLTRFRSVSKQELQALLDQLDIWLLNV